MQDRFILDANVLYSARLRDVFLQLRRNGVAQFFWTDRIEAEWTAALAAQRPALQAAIVRTAEAIRTAFASAYLSDEFNEPITFGLPDPNDEHAARAALSAGAQIISFNLADFPAETLASHGLKLSRPMLLYSN